MPLEEGVEKLLSAERSVSRIRVTALLFLTLVYGFLYDRSHGDPTLAVAVLSFGWAYSLATVFLEPQRRFPVMMTSAFTIAVEATFISTWVYATGGYASPFFLLYYVSTTSVAFLHGDRETLVAASVYSAAYFVALFLEGSAAGNVTGITVRVGFIFLVAGMAALLTREAADQAKAHVESVRRMEEARTAEARFRGLVEAAPDAMIISDRDGRIVLINSETERIFGYDRDQLLGKPVELLVPEGLSRLHATLDPATPLSGARELSGRRQDGRPFPAEVRVSPVETEGGLLYTSTIRDLTERKRAEEERITSMERLKELERLRELDHFKTQFINTAAHELGTPLTPIKLQLHLLRTGARAGELSDGQRKSLDILDRNVNRLHELVKDVLDVARLQASRLGIRRQPTDLNRLVLEAAESFQEPARQANVVLEARLTPSVTLEIDPNRITQVLFNLVSNALKFTPARGRVTLETSIMNDQAVVRVHDTGVGLRPEDIRRLFQPFSQVHDPMEKTRSGSGLGLYISKGIVELHGGRIWCESPGPGLGSTFSFAIPLKVPELPPEMPEVPAPALPEPEREDTVARRARELI